MLCRGLLSGRVTMPAPEHVSTSAQYTGSLVLASIDSSQTKVCFAFDYGPNIDMFLRLRVGTSLCVDPASASKTGWTEKMLSATTQWPTIVSPNKPVLVVCHTPIASRAEKVSKSAACTRRSRERCSNHGRPHLNKTDTWRPTKKRVEQDNPSRDPPTVMAMTRTGSPCANDIAGVPLTTTPALSFHSDHHSRTCRSHPMRCHEQDYCGLVAETSAATHALSKT